MKFIVPPRCAAVVHEDRSLVIDADGSLEAPDDWAPALLAHGIVPWPGETAEEAGDAPVGLGDPDAMSRSALVSALAGLGITPSATGTPELRKALRQAIAARRS